MATTLETSPDAYSRNSPCPHPPFTQHCLSVCSVPGPVRQNKGQGPKAQTTGTEEALGKERVLGAGLGWAGMALWNQIYITLSTNSKVSAIYALNIGS